MRTSEVSVFRAAFDMGANYVDTARVYMGGKNEKIVGEALKGYRDKVYVATKVNPGTPETMKQSIDASMAALDLDRVDVLQLHGISSKAGVMNKAHRDVLAEAKQQGKTRFIGITCHKNEADTLNALADDPDKFFDMVLVVYNFNSKPAVKEAIARVAKTGMGVIAMKTQGGGYKTEALGDLSPHQAALKFVLQNPHVTAAIPAMVDLKQVKEDMAVMNMKFTQADLDILKRYQRATAERLLPSLRRLHVFVPGPPRHRPYQPQLDVRRRLRRSGFGSFDLCGTRAAMRASACGGCAVCTARCANGLNIAERMQRARKVFA